MKRIFFLLAAVAVGGCAPKAIEVSRPFYLYSIENPGEVALFRCPHGPDEGCAIDGLPGPKVTAAGASRRYIDVAQLKSGVVVYYYFERVPQESGGYGANPEVVIGPLTEDQFLQAKTRLGLPDLTVRP